MKLDRLEHKMALSIYHNSLILELTNKWSYKELSEIFEISNVVYNNCTERNKILDAVIRSLINTDSSAYDCLLCDLEDMPLFINDNEGITKHIANYRLKHGK